MYQQQFSRTNPGCIVFLVDRSDSMKLSWGSSGMSLAQLAAQAINKILLELCVKSTKEQGAPMRRYFYTGAFGYGLRVSDGREGVEPLFGGQLAGHGIVPLPDVAANQLAVREESTVDAVGQRPRMPVWIEAAHGHRTPMCEAISVVGDHVYRWTQEFPHSFPPIVINITDGMVTDSPFGDADLTTWAARLAGVATNDGRALLFNVFLAPSQEQPIWFPPSPYGLPEPGPGLFSISSALPGPMVANAHSQGIDVSAGARGLAFNADLAMLIKFLEIGTRVDVRDR